VREDFMSTKQAVFQLNGEQYGIDITDVNTIEKDLVIKKMVNSPDNVKGKVNLRSNEIPVYSLRRKFGIEDKKQDMSTRFLIIEVDGIDVAFEVDHVKGILDLVASDIFDVPSVIKCKDTSYIKSIASSGDGLILLLDRDFLLDDNEIKALQPNS
jgi:purine-binding chemotaxis protein CheW